MLPVFFSSSRSLLNISSAGNLKYLRGSFLIKNLIKGGVCYHSTTRRGGGLPRVYCAHLFKATAPQVHHLSQDLACPLLGEVCIGPQDRVHRLQGPSVPACQWLSESGHQAVWVVVSRVMYPAWLRSTSWTQCRGTLDAQGPFQRSAIRPAPGYLASAGRETARVGENRFCRFL